MQNIIQFFARMNEIGFPYVVLRNFEGFPDSITIGGHIDVDLLVYDLVHWMEIFPQAVRVHPHPRVQFIVPIGETNVYFDIRYIGDDYYPRKFEEAILDSREWDERGFFTPNPVHFRTALAYHVVHHKNANTYERYLGNCSVKELHESLMRSSIGWVAPCDPTVGKFNAYWKGATSIVEKEGEKIKKKQVAYGEYNLTSNEFRILSKVSSPHFPEVSYWELEKGELFMEDCGVPLTVDNLPTDWKAQLVQILLTLKANGIQHRDIRPDNLMVKDGVIKLIDFGWARHIDDAPDDPPSCLGYPYKPTYGFDDNYSMKMIIKQLENQLEEKVQCVYSE